MDWGRPSMLARLSHLLGMQADPHSLPPDPPLHETLVQGLTLISVSATPSVRMRSRMFGTTTSLVSAGRGISAGRASSKSWLLR